nr:PREDICTED: uncharacterized protein LOC109038977 isoform X2 [Bemisia tabaci]
MFFFFPLKMLRFLFYMSLICQMSTNDNALHDAFAEIYAAKAEKIIINTTDFEVVTHSSGYIDKTPLILDLLPLPSHIVIHGPRGFSKSTNLNMLKTFFEHELGENHLAKDPQKTHKLGLFRDKSIFSNGTQFWKHFARYPVIYLDLGSVKTKTFHDFTTSFIEHCVHPLMEKFSYLLNNTNIWESSALKTVSFSKSYKWKKEELIKFGVNLAELVRRHHDTKSILLIDDYDHPVISAVLDTHVSQDDTINIIEFMGAFVNAMTKHSDHIYRSVLTGTIAVTLEYDMDTSSSNVEYYSIFDARIFYNAYGLTGDDLKVLQKQLHVPPSQMELTRSYYQGYNVFDNRFAADTGLYIRWAPVAPKTKIYNTYSVLASLKNVDLKPWWPSGEVPLIPLITADKYATDFEECMLRSCSIDVETYISRFDLLQLKKSLLTPEKPTVTSDIILAFLFQSGYFTPLERNGDERTITAPNYEVQTKMIESFYRTAYLYKRYNYTKEDEKQYVTAMDKLNSTISTFQDVVKSVRNLFRSEAPLGEKFMQAVLLYPLVNSDKFYAYRIEKHDDPFLRYDAVAERRRDNAAIVVTLRCRPQDLKRAVGQIVKAPVGNKFDLLPNRKDKIDLRFIITQDKEVYGYFNYTTSKGDSTSELWPTLKHY